MVISSRSFFRLNSISATLCSRVLCSSGICLLFVPICQIFSKMIDLHHGGHMARAADFPSVLITESFSTPALRICRLGHRSLGPIILAALENLSSHPGRAAAKGRRVRSLFCELVSLLIPDFAFLWATKPMLSSYSYLNTLKLLPYCWQLSSFSKKFK